MTPNPFYKASHSNTKVLEKSGTTKIGVLHVDFSKKENDYYAILFHENLFFFSMVVKGGTILP